VKHAEILALTQAGEKARGGTLYINVEPHAHQGRTPPCTDALIAAGIRRLVASMADPNPKVSGRGFEQLRTAGVQIEVGGLEDEARRLNEHFARYIRSGLPFVTLKAAMSLDGMIAPATTAIQNTGDFTGTWLTGESARAHVHELRHQHDAILTGIGTILADNPLLTDRSGKPRRRPLLRVILDTHLRLPLDSRLVQSAQDDVLVFCTLPESDPRIDALQERGVQTIVVPAGQPHGRPDLKQILRRLPEREITSVMIEGGGTLNAAGLAAGVGDKVFFYYAPTVLGHGSIPFAANAGAKPLEIKSPRFHRFGDDVAIEGYLRDPYAE
jgi:diaminohydroxyphosphoribosylaminopyrimidine deaminase/5-amino-6-(5-phosphoribosylamino)uracil reductase